MTFQVAFRRVNGDRPQFFVQHPFFPGFQLHRIELFQEHVIGEQKEGDAGAPDAIAEMRRQGHLQ